MSWSGAGAVSCRSWLVGRKHAATPRSTDCPSQHLTLPVWGGGWARLTSTAIICRSRGPRFHFLPSVSLWFKASAKWMHYTLRFDKYHCSAVLVIRAAGSVLNQVVGDRALCFFNWSDLTQSWPANIETAHLCGRWITPSSKPSIYIYSRELWFKMKLELRQKIYISIGFDVCHWLTGWISLWDFFLDGQNDIKMLQK